MRSETEVVVDNRAVNLCRFQRLRCMLFSVIAGIIALAIARDLYAATPQEANQVGKQFAESQRQAVSDKAAAPNFADIPQYQGENVEERKYFNDSNIEDDAAQKIVADPSASYVVESHFARPVVNIDRQSDPLFTYEKQVESLATSLSSTYTGCVALPVGSAAAAGFVERTCSVTGTNYTETPTCTESFTEANPVLVSVRVASKGREYLTIQVDFRSGTWQAIEPSDGITRNMLLSALDGSAYCGDSETTISFNGLSHWYQSPSYVGGGPYDNTVNHRVLQHPTCENGMVGIFQVQDKSAGSDTNYVLGGAFDYTFTSYKRNYQCSASEAYTASNLLQRICTDSSDRLINGINVKRDCWNWVSTFQIDKFRHQESAECAALRQQGCGYVGSSCLARADNGNCINEQTRFKCPTSTGTNYVDLCAAAMSCPDGNCASEYQAMQNATPQFQQAAASLAVAGEVAKEFDISSVLIFRGKDLSCDRKAFGFSNCCRDSGWGSDAGLAECSAEEEELGLSREKARTHYVGSYCSDDDAVLGCLEREYVYCTYPSKLSRIIVEQGNQQMNRGYGSPEDPDCDGFTIEELQSLNFNAMDFSEFYVDVMDRAENGNAPNAEQLVQEIAQKLGQVSGN